MANKDNTYEEILADTVAYDIPQVKNPCYADTMRKLPADNDILTPRKQPNMLTYLILGLLVLFVIIALCIGCGNLIYSVLRLQSKINDIEGDVDDIEGNVNDIKGDVAMINQSQQTLVPGLQSKINDIEGDVNNIEGDIAMINRSQQTFVPELQSPNISQFESEISELRSTILELHRNLSESINLTLALEMAIKNIWSPTGLVRSNPATSCSSILQLIDLPLSGYYWIRSTNGSAVRVYCNMTWSCGGVTGGWARIAMLDMTDATNQCPSNLTQLAEAGVQSCGIQSRSPDCSSIYFNVNIQYSKVCGRVLAYQWGTPDAFTVVNRESATLDSIYVDGVSLTYGNPRRHIWTFAASNDENPHILYNCPCVNSGLSVLPAFISENEYFCDTGSADQQDLILYASDPLWDGSGCGPGNLCCSLNTPPWFFKQLPSVTSENIEMRVCSDENRSNENIAMKLYEIYVHY